MNQQKQSKAIQKNLLSVVSEFLNARPQNEKMTVVDRVVLRLSHLSMLLIILAVAITFYEVVMRYLFSSPTIWVYGKTVWLGAIIYLVSGAYAMQRRSHIRITAFYNVVPAWLRVIFDYLALFVIVVFATLMLVGGAEHAVADFSDWIEHGQLLNPRFAGTIKPLVLIMTVVVAVVAINNLLKDHCGFGKASNTSESDRDER